MAETNFINNLISSLIGTISGAVIGSYLTYLFTNRFEKKKTILSIRMDLMRNLITMMDEVENMAVYIDVHIVDCEDVNNCNILESLKVFLEKSNAIARYFNSNYIFLKKYSNLKNVFDNYDKNRRDYYNNYYNMLLKERTEEDNEKLNNITIIFVDSSNEIKKH